MDRPLPPNGLRALSVVLVVAGLLGCGMQSGGADASLAFARWAASARLPVSDADLRQLVGDAAIVAFGESAYGLEEGLISRNQLIQALAASPEFGGIAMETGYAESRAIDAFIQGGAGEARDVALEFLTSGFGNFRANVELIEWMRAANQRRNGNERLRFFGIDLSLGGPTGSSATLAPIECALYRLDRAAPAAADALRRRLAAGLQRVLGEQQPMGERELQAYDELANSLLTEARRSGDPEAEHCAIAATQAGTVQRLAPPANPGARIPPDAICGRSVAAP